MQCNPISSRFAQLRTSLFVGLVVLLSSNVGAQNAGAPNNQAAQSLPPIPVVRDLVEDEVQERRAYILTPRQIDLLKKDVSEARQANITPYPSGKIAKPVSRAFTIDPDVTQQPRLIRLSAGMISTLVFSDQNGNPWLIKSVSFDCNLFDDGAACGKNQAAGARSPTNILKLQPVTPYSYGNIVVELEELTSPINFILATGQSDETDLTLSARVVGRNPNAKPQNISLERMPEHDGMMGYFLDGVAPKGATKLKVGGGSAEAWQHNGALYIRTRLSILSPAFTDHAGSADGMHVFKYQSVFPQLLASVNGVTTMLYVSGF